MIDVQLVAKIGIIGYRNHALRLISLCDGNRNCKLEFIYHPSKHIGDQRITNKLSDLFSCDAVIISSPNYTHYEYLDSLLKNSNCYIFCEKPPVTSIADIEKLEQLPDVMKNRIFFNFNYRFSNISEIIKNNMSSDNMGKLVLVQISNSHGLAFKKQYLDSWRSDGSANLHNILETVSIHHLDLLNFHFGKPNKITYLPSLMSKNGTSYDTCNIMIQYEGGMTVSIFNSYATPLLNEVTMIGTNGVLSIRNNHLEVYSPRDTFDANGYFIAPQIIHSSSFDMETDYQNSLRNSFDYFVSCVLEKKTMNMNHFNTSLETNRLILQIHG